MGKVVLDKDQRQHVIDRVAESKKEHIPNAAEDIDVIVDSEEKAVETILSCATEIGDLTSEMPDDIAKKVNALTQEIFEACMFQDLSGQRMKRVSQSFGSVSSGLEEVLDIIEKGKNPPANKPVEKKDPLANGPNDGDDAHSQDEIDRILNGG